MKIDNLTAEDMRQYLMTSLNTSEVQTALAKKDLTEVVGMLHNDFVMVQSGLKANFSTLLALACVVMGAEPQNISVEETPSGGLRVSIDNTGKLVEVGSFGYETEIVPSYGLFVRMVYHLTNLAVEALRGVLLSGQPALPEPQPQENTIN